MYLPYTKLVSNMEKKTPLKGRNKRNRYYHLTTSIPVQEAQGASMELYRTSSTTSPFLHPPHPRMFSNNQEPAHRTIIVLKHSNNEQSLI